MLIISLNHKPKINRLELLETNVKETEIQQQFYQNENQDNWKSPDFLKNLKEKKKKINEFREGL